MTRLLIAVILSLVSLAASASLKGLVEALAAGNPITEAEREAVAQSPDGLFLLGWLAEGRYGQSPDPSRAVELFQQAAEAGSVAAVAYCWQRCITLNEAVEAQLQQAAERDDPVALFLLSRAAGRRADGYRAMDQRLLAAARAGQFDAIGELYGYHFLEWARARRTPQQALQKLARCRAEGVVICYYLSGAVQQRQGDSAEALHYWQMLRWLDPELFARYLDDAALAELQQRLPQQNLEPIRSRAALQLATQAKTGNPRIDRFRFCASDPGYRCVALLAEHDGDCLPAPLERTLFADYRRSAGYRACLQGP